MAIDWILMGIGSLIRNTVSFFFNDTYDDEDAEYDTASESGESCEEEANRGDYGSRRTDREGITERTERRETSEKTTCEEIAKNITREEPTESSEVTSTSRFQVERKFSSDIIPPILYAASLSATATLLDGDKPPFVFNKLSEVLSFCKKYKPHQPRWKQVQNVQEAVDFCMSYDENCNVDVVSQNVESLPYPSLPPQMMVALRKLIASDEIEPVKSLIEGNPRYLIGSGDTPTILQEGCRYNAFHVAAKSNSWKTLRYLIGCLRSREFFEKLYPNTPESNDSRMKFLLDLYLNTPDKTRNNETPLHFACKFGSYECVKILLDQPECDRALKNGENLGADEIICSRDGSTCLKEKISALFEEMLFIPIFRDEPNSQARIGTPINTKQLDTLLSPTAIDSPIRSPTNIKAALGPIKSPQAYDIMSDLLKTRFSPQDVELRRRDPEKGVETVARNIARRHGVPWSEEWEFLGASLDLVTNEGLSRLNQYLEQIYPRSEVVKYINGDTPTKPDYQVWTALTPPVIDEVMKSNERPHLKKWLKLMRNFSGDEMKRWRTPRKQSDSSKSFSIEEADVDCLVDLMKRFDVDDP